MKTVLSRKAAMLAGGLAHFLRPKIAQDAKIDLPSILKGLSSQNYKSEQPKIVAAITSALDGKLAKDASLADIGKVMDEMADVPMEEGLDTDPNSGLPMEAEALKQKVMGDVDPKTAIQQLLAGKVDDALLAQVLQCLGGEKTPPALDEESDDDKKKEEQAMDKRLQGFISKEDAAANAKIAEDNAVKRVTENLKAVQDARNFVRPWAGEIAIACDSALDVYKAAAKVAKIDGVDNLKEVDSFKAIFQSRPLPGARRVETETAIAADAASAKGYNDRFKNAGRIVNLG
jgi:hypothetical protein